MRVRMLHVIATAACLLPAIGFSSSVAVSSRARATDVGATSRVLSFIPACETRPPRTEFMPSGAPSRPARRRDAPVEVFLAGRDPARGYVVLGRLELEAHNRRTDLRTLLEHARREARRRGGDALLGVTPRSTTANAGGPLALTATVVGW